MADADMADADAKEEEAEPEGLGEVAVGKGLAGVLGLLKERGALKGKIEWGGRTMDKKRSKLWGVVDEEEEEKKKEAIKEVRIERLDEFGREVSCTVESLCRKAYASAHVI